MSFKLFFVVENLTIDPMDCQLTTTFQEIYQYVNQYLETTCGEGYIGLISNFQDGSLIWPADGNELSVVYSQGEGQAYVKVIPPQIVDMYIDGQHIQQLNVKANQTIADVQTLIQQCSKQILDPFQTFSDIVEYQLFEENGNPIIDPSSIDINQTFQYYSSGKLILNMVRKTENQEVEQQQPEAEVEQYQPQLRITNQEEDPLQNLIVLSNVSLLIDPQGTYVAYKFHQPIRMDGIFKKSLCKSKNQIILHVQLDQLNWKTSNTISYAQFDDHGLAIRWSDDTYNIITVQ